MNQKAQSVLVKNLAYLLLILLNQLLMAQKNDTLILEPQLSKVTLYYNAAQLTQGAWLNLPEGEHVLYFENIPDGKSAQFSYIEGMKIQRTEVIGANELIKYKNKRYEHLASDALKSKLVKQIDSLRIAKTNYSKSRQQAYDQIIARWSPLPSKELSISTLENSYSAMTAFAAQTRQQENNFDEKQKQLENNLNEIDKNNLRNTISSILAISVKCNKSISDTLYVTYMAKDAQWEPYYEIHISDIGQPVQLQLFAQITQKSGKDWSNIPLTLINRNYETAVQQAFKQERFKTLVVGISAQKTTRLLPGELPIFTPSLGWVQSGVGRSGLSEDPEKSKVWQLDTMYKAQQSILESRSLLTKAFYLKNNASARYPLTQVHQISTEYEFLAYPRIGRDVYLTAKLKNWQQYDLISAKADVYLDGFWACITDLNTTSMSESILLSVGKVDGIYVERGSMVDNFTQSDASGDTHALKGTYKIHLMNQRKKNIELKIYDQIPVSNMVDVTVKPIKLTGAKLDDESGKLLWDISATPNTPITLQAEYEIRYPRGTLLEIKER